MNETSLTPRDQAGLPQTGGEGSKIFVNLEGGRGGIPEASPGFGSGGSRPMGNPAIVALALLVMSAGAIYAMRKVGTVSGISAQAMSVNYTPSAINPDFELRFDRAMDELARSGRPLQVTLDEQHLAPFQVSSRLALSRQPLDDGSAAARAQQARLAQQRAEEERRNAADAARRVDHAVASIRLMGMIGGRVPVATIDGKLVRVGETIADGVLTVESIDGRSVVVGAAGRRFELQMGQAPRELTD